MMRNIVTALLFSWSAAAKTLEIDFTSPDVFSSTSTAINNQVTGTIHPGFEADHSVAGLGVESINVGGGGDGEFSLATYADFDTDGDVSSNVIILDTSRVYEFSSFHLQNGFTLTGAGSEPLRIRVLGNAQIDGTIDLSGGDGEDGNPDTGAVGDLDVVARGGTACCGGGAGGDGATLTNPSGEDGGETAMNSRGTGGGPSAAGLRAGGGGGGGAHQGNGSNGEDVGADAFGNLGGSGGVAGNPSGDESARLGGSGGGGGGLYDQGPQAGNSTGGGGGGGGGSLQLYVGGTVNLSGTSLIDVSGGDGGGRADNARLSGSGGGGAGGSVYLFSGGAITISGTINTLGGNGGIGSATDINGGGRDDGEGGDGGDGWPWIVVPTGTLVGVVVGGTILNPPINNAGTSRRQTTSVFESKVIDTGLAFPEIVNWDAEQTVPEGTEVSYEFAGSSDGFVTDDTGFSPTSRLDSLTGKRYLKIRATLTTADPLVLPTINSMSLSMYPRYEFAFASCGRAFPQRRTAQPLTFIFWSLVALIPYGFRFASWGWNRIGRR